MFAKLTLNEDKVKMKKRNEFSVINQKNQFDYGHPDWNQDIITTNRLAQSFKNVKKK